MKNLENTGDVSNSADKILTTLIDLLVDCVEGKNDVDTVNLRKEDIIDHVATMMSENGVNGPVAVPGVDGQVLLAARDMDEEGRGQPDSGHGRLHLKIRCTGQRLGKRLE